MIKLIIFDWDDVFSLGSKEGYFACYRATLKKLNVNLDPQEEKKRILAKWGQPFREELRELLKEHPELLDKACSIFETHIFGDTFHQQLKIIPGAVDLLNRLSQQYLLAIVTGSNIENLKKTFQRFNIPGVFVQIVASHQIKDPTKSKPHPFMVNKILKTQKLKPEHAILVGDATNDILMAQKAKVEPVAVLTGHLDQKQAQKLGVKHIISDVTHLEKILQKLK